MTITTKSPRRGFPRNIDLAGPEGNAFAIMGIARSMGRTLGHSNASIDALLKDMQSGDYVHLVKTMDKFFGKNVLFLSAGLIFGDEDHEFVVPSK